MVYKVSALTSSQASLSTSNPKSNKTYDIAKELFQRFNQIFQAVYKKIQASYNFFAVNKFSIAMLVTAIIFAPINQSVAASAIALGVVNAAIYSQTDEYKFRLVARSYIRALSDFNAHFKDGKVINPKGLQKSLETLREQKKRLSYIFTNVKTANQLASWRKYLKSIDSHLNIDAWAVAYINNRFSRFSSSQSIDKHLDELVDELAESLMVIFKKSYQYTIDSYADNCISVTKGSYKKVNLKNLARLILKEHKISQALNKSENEIIQDFARAWTKIRVKRILGLSEVGNPFFQPKDFKLLFNE